MRKKGQAAMEFLMTYGWAILVVLAAIGALAYLGVLSPEKFVGSRCVMGDPFTCNDALFLGEDTNVTLVVVAGREALITDIDLESLSGSTVQTCTDTDGAVVKFQNQSTQPIAAATPLTVGSGTAYTFIILCNSGVDVPVGDKLDAEVTVSYSLTGSGLPKTSKGELKNFRAQ